MKHDVRNCCYKNLEMEWYLLDVGVIMWLYELVGIVDY